MQKDFTYHIYSGLIKSFKKSGYGLLPYIHYISNNNEYEKCVVLRHDVDRLPKNSLQMAELENRLGVKASYYFRMVKQSYDENIIRRIMDMGHEIGYHYEDLDMSSRGQKSEIRGRKDIDYNALLDKAIDSFERNLSILREVVPVKTICMHGSPLSKWDNRDLWKKYDYRNYGIIA